MIDFSKLDKLIHEKGRLAIMTLLVARKEWRFQDLKSEHLVRLAIPVTMAGKAEMRQLAAIQAAETHPPA